MTASLLTKAAVLLSWLSSSDWASSEIFSENKAELDQLRAGSVFKLYSSPPSGSSATSSAASTSASNPPAPPGLLHGSLVVSDRSGGCSVLSWSSVLGLVGGPGKSVPLGSDLVVQTPQVLGGGAVEVEPPVADEVVLVEEGSVGTEEAVLGQTSGSVSSADVESLALSLGVSVVTSVNLAVTDESGLWNLGVDGIVLSGHPGDVGGESGQGGVVASRLVGGHGVAGSVDRHVRVVRVVGGGVA